MKPTILDDSSTAPLASVAAMRARLPPRAALLVYHADGNHVVTLDGGESCVVGRGRPADVVVDEASLSRSHARFVFDGERVVVDDVGSRNGTFLNGERLAA